MKKEKGRRKDAECRTQLHQPPISFFSVSLSRICWVFFSFTQRPMLCRSKINCKTFSILLENVIFCYLKCCCFFFACFLIVFHRLFFLFITLGSDSEIFSIILENKCYTCWMFTPITNSRHSNQCFKIEHFSRSSSWVNKPF